MKLRALIFDVDGTLADTEEAHRAAFNDAFRQHGLDWHWSKPQYAALLKTTGGKERLAAFADSLRLSAVERQAVAEKIPAIHRTKTDQYVRLAGAGTLPLRDGVARLIDEAEAAGIALAIATTTTFDNIRVLLTSNLGARALERFDVIAAADQVPRKKPSPDVYHYVLNELGQPPERCVAFEDSANGLAAAKAAGLFTVVTPCYWTQTDDLSAADLLLPTLGSTDHPLPPDAAKLVGNGVLGIREIDRRLTAAQICA